MHRFGKALKGSFTLENIVQNGVWLLLNAAANIIWPLVAGSVSEISTGKLVGWGVALFLVASAMILGLHRRGRGRPVAVHSTVAAPAAPTPRPLTAPTPRYAPLAHPSLAAGAADELEDALAGFGRHADAQDWYAAHQQGFGMAHQALYGAVRASDNPSQVIGGLVNHRRNQRTEERRAAVDAEIRVRLEGYIERLRAGVPPGVTVSALDPTRRPADQHSQGCAGWTQHLLVHNDGPGSSFLAEVSTVITGLDYTNWGRGVTLAWEENGGNRDRHIGHGGSGNLKATLTYFNPVTNRYYLRLWVPAPGGYELGVEREMTKNIAGFGLRIFDTARDSFAEYRMTLAVDTEAKPLLTAEAVA